jgi:bacillithiol system protein YtxJ
MNWIDLNSIEQLNKIRELSKIRPQAIFKHSTRCFISSIIKERLELVGPPGETDFYFLDLLRYRQISNKIASEFSVQHQSPQILLIKNGECVYDESHNDIEMDEIAAQAK